VTATLSEQPKLRRALGPLGLTVFGVTYMTVITVFTTYGIVNQVTDGHLYPAIVRRRHWLRHRLGHAA
jgi:hypothetical protein